MILMTKVSCWLMSILSKTLRLDLEDVDTKKKGQKRTRAALQFRLPTFVTSKWVYDGSRWPSATRGKTMFKSQARAMGKNCQIWKRWGGNHAMLQSAFFFESTRGGFVVPQAERECNHLSGKSAHLFRSLSSVTRYGPWWRRICVEGTIPSVREIKPRGGMGVVQSSAVRQPISALVGSVEAIFRSEDWELSWSCELVTQGND